MKNNEKIKTNGLKIINRKLQNNTIYYFPYKPSEIVTCIGNWDQIKYLEYITVPRKFYMTIDEYTKKETRRKYYKNKIKSI